MRFGLAVFVSLAVIVGCSRTSGPPRHLVLIVVDTLRADVLGCYGGTAKTPNIDQLAAEGVQFTQARSHIPITGPSHTTLFTSLLPHQHGVLNNTQVVPDNVVPLAQMLQRSGFQTTGVVSLGVLASKFGFSRGFDRYENQTRRRFWRDAAEVNEVALPLIHPEPRQRQFFWIHYSDPHAPYASPDADLPLVDCLVDGEFATSLRLDGRRFSIPVALPPGETVLEVRPSSGDVARRIVFRRLRVRGGDASIEGRKNLTRIHASETIRSHMGRTPLSAVLINPGPEPVVGELEGTIELSPRPEDLHHLYRQEVEFADREIGRLIETLRSAGLWEDSLVFFVGDHGEGLGDSDRFGHVNHLTNETLRVPLILVSPGRLPAGAVVTSSVRLIDVLPTALAMLSVDSHGDLMGETMLPMIENPGLDRPTVAMTFQPEAKVDRRGLVVRGFKYIWTIDNDERELYDLGNDPRELENIAPQMPDVVEAMHEELLVALALNEADEFARPAELSREEVEGLEALGYVQ
jgi:iduronate 2-sulfatase